MCGFVCTLSVISATETTFCPAKCSQIMLNSQVTRGVSLYDFARVLSAASAIFVLQNVPSSQITRSFQWYCYVCTLSVSPATETTFVLQNVHRLS